MNRYFVGVDLGATSGRVILATLCGDGIALEVLHRFPNRLLALGGKFYWNIYSLYEEILHGLTLAGQRRIPVDSIGIDTWGVDMACVAADGTLAGLPRAYRDPYTNGVPEEFFRKIPRQEVYRRTGIQIMNFNSLFQLRAARGEGMSALEMPRRCFSCPTRCRTCSPARRYASIRSSRRRSSWIPVRGRSTACCCARRVSIPRFSRGW